MTHLTRKLFSSCLKYSTNQNLFLLKHHLHYKVSAVRIKAAVLCSKLYLKFVDFIFRSLACLVRSGSSIL